MVLMHKYKGSLMASLESQRDMFVGYSLEFYNEATLSHLFACHPSWNWMTQILRNGSEWPLEPLAENKERADVAETLAFGNHKGHIPATQAPQETRLNGCSLRVLSPATAREGHQDPKHPHRTDGHPKAKYDQ